MTYDREDFSPQPKPRGRIFDALDDDAEAAARKRRVYAAVDARDQKRCRVCCRRGNPYSSEAIGKIHRVHIRDASLLGPMSSANIFSGCWICHALIHQKKLFVIGADADETSVRLRFEIDRSVVWDVFGGRTLPSHVSLTEEARR